MLDEAERDASFRKLVSAALAARKGPEAIAKLVDRRLGGLERARGFIDWDKARTFRDDLAATVVTISGELGGSVTRHGHRPTVTVHRHARTGV
ncbi:hypothetical protein ISN39_16995 [Rhizobium sp. 007]|nr:DUF6880 family protein [Rhizobium sp. 007]QPB19257.1 hypothetical protein ISN39_16995 [Rhizobium sp. 007]